MSNTNTTNLHTTNTNTVNNLNIFTFIKDIYQSLKHIDKTLNISNEDLNKRISKIEENQQLLIDKMTTMEIVLNNISEMSKPNSGLDKNIEFELLEKMKKLNQNDTNNSKLVLKPNELTFANILENNYGFNDINQSFNPQSVNPQSFNTQSYNPQSFNPQSFNTNYTPVDNYMFLEDVLETSTMNNNTNTNNNKEESLDTLLF